MANQSDKRKKLENLEFGNVIKYETGCGYATYLVVEGVDNGRVSGQMAKPIGVNSISIENLLEEENLEIVTKWKELK